MLLVQLAQLAGREVGISPEKFYRYRGHLAHRDVDHMQTMAARLAILRAYGPDVDIRCEFHASTKDVTAPQCYTVAEALMGHPCPRMRP